ncbi:hypothetical protein D9757_004339 [Collybiopsis confluens]|uniref:Telomere replication protein EST3 n=1 Tax=Collybiopsis confluens TaxID=2823264 RepID=A0A8H5MD03_9AGAR|nr:hypothetical protein D9757_004339 [Collybiopsis confluens]
MIKPWIRDYVYQISETKGAAIYAIGWCSESKRAQIVQILNADQGSILWARLSDTKYYIPVKFTAETSQKLNRSSLGRNKTAIITISKFRLIHTRIPHLDHSGKCKLTPEAHLALECSDFSSKGFIGDPILETPESIENVGELGKYAIELRADGGNANFLKLRAEKSVLSKTKESARASPSLQEQRRRASAEKKENPTSGDGNAQAPGINVQALRIKSKTTGPLSPQSFAREYERRMLIFASSDAPRHGETFECWKTLNRWRGAQTRQVGKSDKPSAVYMPDIIIAKKVRGRSRSPISQKSQNPKANQQLTPRTSSRGSSPISSQTRRSSVPISNWSVSERGNSSDGNLSEQELGEGEEEQITQSSPVHLRNSALPSCNGFDPDPLSLAPPPPAQPRRTPAHITNSQQFSPAHTQDSVASVPPFNLDSSLSVKKEVSLIRIRHTSPLGPSRRPTGVVPVRRPTGVDDDSYVLQAIPESSQFRPSPPTPAQRPRPMYSPFHKTVQRKIPPPRQPIRPRPGSPIRVLVPNSDTSGTQSQSQSRNDSQSLANPRAQNLSLNYSPTHSLSQSQGRVQADSQPADAWSPQQDQRVFTLQAHGEQLDGDRYHDSCLSQGDSASLEVHPGTQVRDPPEPTNEDIAGIVRPLSEISPGTKGRGLINFCEAHDGDRDEKSEDGRGLQAAALSLIVRKLPVENTGSKSIPAAMQTHVPHEPQAWIEPTFLRFYRQRLANMRTDVMDAKPKIHKSDSGVSAKCGQVMGKSRPIKRAYTDQSDLRPSKKKRNELDSLSGFSGELDEVPAGGPFMSWDRVMAISLRVGQARSAQQPR